MATIEAPTHAPIIDRVTTLSGSVYEFAWTDPEWPQHGPRHGSVRKDGGKWDQIRMVTGRFEVGDRMFWADEDDRVVHTTRVALIETVLL